MQHAHIYMYTFMFGLPVVGAPLRTAPSQEDIRPLLASPHHPHRKNDPPETQPTREHAAPAPAQAPQVAPKPAWPQPQQSTEHPLVVTRQSGARMNAPWTELRDPRKARARDGMAHPQEGKAAKTQSPNPMEAMAFFC